jgi:hypothetical protein
MVSGNRWRAPYLMGSGERMHIVAVAESGAKTMDPKLAIMFLLIGAVLTLSSFEGGVLDRARQQIKRTIRNGR